MRVMLRFSIPTGPGNRAIADGRIGAILGQLHERLRPEASYFLVLDGRRTGILFCDLPDLAQIPVIAEPLFTGLEADVDFVPAMNLTELQGGLGKAERKG